MAEIRNLTCPTCGAPVAHTSEKCEYCGSYLSAQNRTPKKEVGATFHTPKGDYSFSFGAHNAKPESEPEHAAPRSLPLSKNRIVAALFALLLGGLGIHWFYLGRIGRGFACILFSWTFIPTMISFIDGILFLCKTEEEWAQQYPA